MRKYRVFISYSHEDALIAKTVSDALEKNGLDPMCDRDFRRGHGFPDQIKNFIAYSHIFMPIVTKSSSQRPWVHQEIGYAMALNIPVLPVMLDEVPGEMIKDLNAISWSHNSDILKERLSSEEFRILVKDAQDKSDAYFECAELPQERTMKMADYASQILKLGRYGHIRQKAILSSFKIPNDPIIEPIWEEIGYKDDFNNKLLLKERENLEQHALKKGCSLIIDPYVYINNIKEGKLDKNGKKYEPLEVIKRFKILVDFFNALKKNKVKNVKIAIAEDYRKGENITIVGNWFSAESVSVSRGKGIRQTIFTRHAPTVLNRIELFNHEIDSILKEQKIPYADSLEIAIEKIELMIDELNGETY